MRKLGISDVERMQREIEEEQHNKMLQES